MVKIESPSGGGEQPRGVARAGPRGGGRVEVYGIYFDFDSATLKPESDPVLSRIAAVLERNPGWHLSIEGHTDSVGEEAYNQDLSERRAAAVEQALVERWEIAPDRLTTAGFGESRPKASNETLAGRAENRRVELVRGEGAEGIEPIGRCRSGGCDREVPGTFHREVPGGARDS
ncbi:MAG: OmpA family protein [Thermoanaerobaculia bacterium]